MKRSEIIKIITDYCKNEELLISNHDRYRESSASILLHKLEDAGMFYCPVEDLGEFRLRTPKGWEPENE